YCGTDASTGNAADGEHVIGEFRKFVLRLGEKKSGVKGGVSTAALSRNNINGMLALPFHPRPPRTFPSGQADIQPVIKPLRHGRGGGRCPLPAARYGMVVVEVEGSKEHDEAKKQADERAPMRKEQ